MRRPQALVAQDEPAVRKGEERSQHATRQALVSLLRRYGGAGVVFMDRLPAELRY
jgi:hypothetical protein